MTAQPVSPPAAISSATFVSVPDGPNEATEYSAAMVVVTTGDHAQLIVVDLLTHPCGEHFLADIASAVPGRAGSALGDARSAAALIQSLADAHLPTRLTAVPTTAETELSVDDLSAREREVLQLITDGLMNHEIAIRLFLSPNTIKTHIRCIYRKIGVNRRAQAVSWGLHHGLGTQPGSTRGAAVAPHRSNL